MFFLLMQVVEFELITFLTNIEKSYGSSSRSFFEFTAQLHKFAINT